MRKPFSSNLFYFIGEVSSRMEENQNFFLPYVLDLIHLLEQKICLDSNLRVKQMYESDVLKKLYVYV